MALNQILAFPESDFVSFISDPQKLANDKMNRSILSHDIHNSDRRLINIDNEFVQKVSKIILNSLEKRERYFLKQHDNIVPVFKNIQEYWAHSGLCLWLQATRPVCRSLCCWAWCVNICENWTNEDFHPLLSKKSDNWECQASSTKTCRYLSRPFPYSF